jgi:hypothetical protein
VRRCNIGGFCGDYIVETIAAERLMMQNISERWHAALVGPSNFTVQQLRMWMPVKHWAALAISPQMTAIGDGIGANTLSQSWQADSLFNALDLADTVNINAQDLRTWYHAAQYHGG